MINKQLLETVADFNFWHREQDTGIPRSELGEAMRFADDIDFALIIAGVRRAGKTYLARQMLREKISHGARPEQTLYINFEDPVLEPHLSTEALTDFYETYRYALNRDDRAYIIFDEVQRVPKWEKWIRIMLEKKTNAKFILTGSSARLAKGTQAEVLTGRSVTLPLYPLSFPDFLQFKQYVPKRVETGRSMAPLLTEYLEFGGFPLIVLEPDSIKKQVYLRELFDDIVTKDIMLRHRLRGPEARQLAFVLVNQFSSLVSVRRLRGLLTTISQRKGVSPTSVNRYLNLFTDAFLFFSIPIFSYKIREAMRYPKKLYGIDTGFLNTLTLRFSDNIGRLYENAAAQALWRQEGNQSLFYWRGERQEVDFVRKDDKTITQLIQVCFDLGEEKTRARELAALQAAREELACDMLVVITREEEGEEKLKGATVRFVPLWKWLLATGVKLSI